MQRFFEFVFNVPGDCFCCCWSISCFLETVEHMEGDKRWRSICTLGMSLLSLIIVFLLSVSLCPKYYWSEINQMVMFNSTTTTPHLDYSSSTYIPTVYLNSTELLLENTSSSIQATNSLLKSPINDIASDYDDIHTEELHQDEAYNLTIHSVTYQQIALHLNLWHINYCTQNHTNNTFWKTYLNANVNPPQQLNRRELINNTDIETNLTCSFITYRESGTTSSTQDLSLWFIIFVMALLLLGSGCILGTHPLFDRCHRKNTTLRSSIQKILAIAITILCACILNWSSFVFAAVFENQVEKYAEWQQNEPITQSNLGTGMLAVNGAMLLGIILSVVHCGAPIRTDLNVDGNPRGNQNAARQGNAGGDQSNVDEEEKSNERSSNIHLTHRQRVLLRRIPGGHSSMSNLAILTNPDSWFKNNENREAQSTRSRSDESAGNAQLGVAGNHSIQNVHGSHIVEIADDDSKHEKGSVDDGDELKEFEYQKMSGQDEGDEKMYNVNLSMKRIRKKEKRSTKDDGKKVSLLLDDSDEDEPNVNESNHDLD